MLLEQLDNRISDITAIQKVRWIDEGVIEKKDHIVVYSCQKRYHIFGTGFIKHKRIKHLVMDFKAKSSRICRLRIRVFLIIVSCVHAQTEDKNEEEKDGFYDDLDKTYEKCPGRDVKIIIGDLNAKIGREDIYRPINAKYSGHTKSNDNGIRVINYVSSRNLVIGTAMFDHKDIHKMTRKSPDRSTFNQTDHFIIDAGYVSNLPVAARSKAVVFNRGYAKTP
jgi:exonuclease III